MLRKLKPFFFIVLIAGLLFIAPQAEAQCSICQKTVMQLGDKPAKGFNAGILFLMAIPFATIGVVGYKWYRASK